MRSVSSTGGEKGVKDEAYSLIPVEPLAELARHFNAGAKKYAAHQWRAGYEWHKSYDAIQRHLRAFWGGEDYDVCHADEEGCAPFPDATEPLPQGHTTCYNHTGSHHMACVAWHSFVLLEFKDTHPEFDDRYKRDPFAGFDLERNKAAFQEAVKSYPFNVVFPPSKVLDEDSLRAQFVKAAAHPEPIEDEPRDNLLAPGEDESRALGCPAGGCINCS